MKKMRRVYVYEDDFLAVIQFGLIRAKNKQFIIPGNHSFVGFLQEYVKEK